MDDTVGASSLSTAILEIATRLAEQLGSPNTERRIAAISLIATLDRLTDRALHTVVQEAREAGFSWQQIGDITGTSRQGAAQRFGTDPPMFMSIADVAIAPLPDALPLAVTLATAFLGDDHDEFRAFMAKSMAAALTPRRIADHRRRLAATMGTLEAVDGDLGEVALLGDLTVVTIPLRFSAGDAIVKVTFTPERQMLGLWIEPASPHEGAPDHG